ncbi:MAG: hypothetical protein Q8M76_19750, partial [Spirochaetaceae bacterium]|nr:hypothetical protein [Spirochaetaceae bacterium]
MIANRSLTVSFILIACLSAPAQAPAQAQAQGKGNLVILGAKPDMKLALDGEDRGALGSGVLRNIPAGEHAIELVSSGSYWTAMVNVQADETTSVEAKPSPIGRIEVTAPPDAIILVEWTSSAGTGAGTGSRSIQGGGAFERAIAGPYELIASGPGYIEARTRIDVAQGATARWTPWTKGYLEFVGAPSGASFKVEGQDAAFGKAVGTVGEILPGTVRVGLTAPDYYDKTVEIQVQVGKITRIDVVMEPFVPGNVDLYGLPAQATVRVDGKVVDVERQETGVARVAGLPARKTLRLEIIDPRASSLERQSAVFSLTLGSGETRAIELKIGALRLPYIPKLSRVLLGVGTAESEIATSTEVYATDFELAGLLAGTYQVKVEGPMPYSGTVVVQEGVKSIPRTYGESFVASFTAERAQHRVLIVKAASWRTAGWISATAGILGCIGAGTVYYLGTQALDEYRSAPSTVDALAARTRAESLASLFTGAIAASSVSLGLSPLFFLLAPDDSVAREAIEMLDEQIKAKEMEFRRKYQRFEEELHEHNRQVLAREEAQL